MCIKNPHILLCVDELPDDTDNKGFSYCFFTEVIIEYDDGTCCYFRDSGWINKG